jgi:hypothetical protein
MLARRAAVPVSLHVATERRCPSRWRSPLTIWWPRRLTNTGKHAQASSVKVRPWAHTGRQVTNYACVIGHAADMLCSSAPDATD